MSDFADGASLREGSYDYDSLINTLQLLKSKGTARLTLGGRDVSVDDVLAALQRAYVVGYDDASHDAGESLYDFLDAIEDPAQEEQLRAVETKLYVETYLPLLNGDQESVIRLHYGLGGGPELTLEEIAEELFMGIDYVKWNLEQGLGYLKSFMEHDAQFETD